MSGKNGSGKLRKAPPLIKANRRGATAKHQLERRPAPELKSWDELLSIKWYCKPTQSPADAVWHLPADEGSGRTQCGKKLNTGWISTNLIVEGENCKQCQRGNRGLPSNIHEVASDIVDMLEATNPEARPRVMQFVQMGKGKPKPKLAIDYSAGRQRYCLTISMSKVKD